MVGCRECCSKEGGKDTNYLYREEDTAGSRSCRKVCSVEVVEKFICEEDSAEEYGDCQDETKGDTAGYRRCDLIPLVLFAPTADFRRERRGNG